jgi:hypothetical protein
VSAGTDGDDAGSVADGGAGAGVDASAAAFADDSVAGALVAVALFVATSVETGDPRPLK